MNYPYTQATTALPFTALGHAPQTALAKRAAGLDIDLSGASAWLTHRTNPPAAGWFGKWTGRRANPADPDAESWVALVVVAQHVFIATWGDTSGVAVLDAPRSALRVEHGFVPGLASTAQYGLTLTGFVTATLEHGGASSFFLPLDESSHGRAAREALGG